MPSEVEMQSEDCSDVPQSLDQSDLRTTVELLKDSLSPSALRETDLLEISEEMLAVPIPGNVSRENEIKRRITEWVDHSAYSHLKSRRAKRGKLVSAGNLARTGSSDDESDENGEAWLSRANLTQQLSVERERAHCQDVIHHSLKTATNANRQALLKVLPVVEPGDSVREVARQANLHPAQVQRVFDHVRDAVSEPKLRVKRSVPAAKVARDYNPGGVRMEDYMMIHRGATISYIGHAREKCKRTRSLNSIPRISDLPRPRNARSVQHPSFGQGIVLRERILDSGPCVDVEFDDSIRRTLLADNLTPSP
jgi:hypothetical protein